MFLTFLGLEIEANKTELLIRVAARFLKKQQQQQTLN